MRATTLTSMTAIALFWYPQLCAAQDKKADHAVHAPAKPDADSAKKKNASRLGSLSPDEARRAARAHARAAAASKKTDHVRAAAAAPEKPADPAKASEPTKAVETTKAAETTKSIDTAKQAETTKTTDAQTATTATDTTAKPADTAQATDQTKAADAATSKPAAQADRVAAKSPDSNITPTTGRSATVDTEARDDRPTKRAVRTAERKRKAARREARRHSRDRFAEDQDAQGSSRFRRVGPGEQRIYPEYPGYAERVVVAPQARWRYVEGPAYAPGYPPYPQPYDGY